MPASLKKALDAMTSPHLEAWQMMGRFEFANQSWTEEAQGLTTDGVFWYISSNNPSMRAVWKFDSRFKPLGFTVVPPDLGEIVQNKLGAHELSLHIGDIDYFNGQIYAPLEPRLLVARFDLTPRFLDFHPLRPGRNGEMPQKQMPWCAINPWNGWLYSSNFDLVEFIYAYDPQNNFMLCAELKLNGPPLDRVQGGVFSQNGHLYLTSDFTGDVRCYSVLNGEWLGSVKIPYAPDFDEFEEIEGIAIQPEAQADNAASVYVLVLDNDLNADDVFLVQYRVPEKMHL